MKTTKTSIKEAPNGTSIGQSINNETRINGLTLGEALSKLEKYMYKDHYYTPFNGLPAYLKFAGYNYEPDDVAEYIDSESSDAFFVILGEDADFPSNTALGGTGNDSIWSITAEAINVAFNKTVDEAAEREGALV